MYTCNCCRRPLTNSTRDALCLRCLYVIDGGGAFDDELETKPGKRRSSIEADVSAAVI